MKTSFFLFKLQKKKEKLKILVKRIFLKKHTSLTLLRPKLFNDCNLKTIAAILSTKY